MVSGEMRGFSFLDLLKWWTVIGLAVVAAGFGFFGYLQADPLSDVADGPSLVSHLFINAYRTLQLFIVDADAAKYDFWALHIARFVAPMATLSLVAKFLVEALYHRTVLSLLKRSRGHIIVVGLGELGRSIAEHLSSSERRVVAIQNEASDDDREFCRTNGILLVEGDGTSGVALEMAAIGSASQVFATGDSDVANVETCVRAAQSAAAAAHTINIQVHLSDRYFMGQLQSIEQELRADLSETTFINFFSRYELVARHFFSKFDLLEAARLMGHDRLHVLIFGFGDLGESLFVGALLRNHSQYLGKPRITVVDAEAETARARLLRRMPAIEDVADISFLPFTAGEGDMSALLKTINRRGPVTATFVSLPEETKGITVALDIFSSVKAGDSSGGPVFFRCDKTTSFVDDLAAAESKRISACIRPFRTEFGGDIIEELTSDGDLLAQRIHEAYCAQRAQEREPGDDQTLSPGEQPWGHLSETFRKANRRAGDHLRVKLRAAGFRLGVDTTLRIALKPEDHLWSSSEGLAALGVAENARWRTDRVIEGFTYAPVRNDNRKHHNLLVPFDDLRDEDKAKDRQQLEFLDRDVLHSQTDPANLTMVRRERQIGMVVDVGASADDGESGTSEAINSLADDVSEIVASHFPGDAYSLFAVIGSELQMNIVTAVHSALEAVSSDVRLFPVTGPDRSYDLELGLASANLTSAVRWIIEPSPGSTLSEPASALPNRAALELLITLSRDDGGWAVLEQA